MEDNISSKINIHQEHNFLYFLQKYSLTTYLQDFIFSLSSAFSYDLIMIQPSMNDNIMLNSKFLNEMSHDLESHRRSQNVKTF